MKQSPNWPIYIAFLIPIALIGFIVASVYLPQLGLKPKYNFLYSTNSDYYYAGDTHYEVKDSHLNLVISPAPSPYVYPGETPPPPIPTPTPKPPKLYVYDVTKDTVIKATEEQAKNYTLSDQPASPDGYQVARGSDDYSYGFFPSLFFGGSSSYDKIFLKSKRGQKQLNISYNGFNSYDFHFVGWILEDK